MAEGQASIEKRDNRVLLCVLDESEELDIALDYASMRSRRTGARVGLLYVLEQPDDFQHWAAVGDLMRDEARAEGERRLQDAAARVKRLSGQTPILYIRDGKIGEAVIAQIGEDHDIAFLILAANTGTQGPGPLIAQITGRAIGQLHIPVVIVPGNMSEDEIRSFA
ncbi:MAG: universal stress protein [Alphaproteobacteria bacterium]|jgi:nucleotide-binding universal stress UspA family protein